MKSKILSFILIAGALIVGVSSGAYADDKWLGERGSNWEEHIKSTKSRAEVMTELEQARQQGLLNFNDATYPRLPEAKSQRTREEVRAEAAETVRNRASQPYDMYYGG